MLLLAALWSGLARAVRQPLFGRDRWRPEDGRVGGPQSANLDGDLSHRQTYQDYHGT
jgi:hypothetical protein